MRKPSKQMLRHGSAVASSKSVRAVIAEKVAAPGTRPTTVLLAATGMTPAILTETVWALAQEKDPLIPDEVVIVTTLGGNQTIERELRTPLPPKGLTVWQELRQAILGSPDERDSRLTLSKARIVEAPDPQTGLSSYLDDLRTPEENAATANFLLSELRRWTELPDTRLIVSIAGGRKTMGALLYACVSLVGRETDRVTHVLVNEPFDDPRLAPRFYFPQQSQQKLKTPDGQTHEAGDGKIDLADIPFVPFRNLFERDLISKPRTFVDLVQRCRTKVEEIARQNARLTLWRGRCEVEVNSARIKTSKSQHILLLFLAERVVAKQPPLTKYAMAVDLLKEFSATLYAKRLANDFSDWRHDARLQNFEEQELRKTLSELKSKLSEAGAPSNALLPFLPEKGRFSLNLEASAITLKD
ncbi:MAG TPA: CRISPR-associated ring nuclease Csm6 [Verrucomicrobiae bacterium]|nr:CRISPR-associated ring nuclease Csm6 [Verrucomicrobiae bacterium]